MLRYPIVRELNTRQLDMNAKMNSESSPVDVHEICGRRISRLPLVKEHKIQ